MKTYTSVDKPVVLDSLLSIAPMIDWSDRHFRVFFRILTPKALTYTEMQVVDTIIHNPKRALARHHSEFPVAIQLGGVDPKKLAYCAQMAEEAGFDEINLNLGCPSDKVKSGGFGACLMTSPDSVSAALQAIKKQVKIPVTAKTRIGIDEEDSYDFFSNFSSMLIDSGCDKLIVHARKAWLKGLSPKQNRTIPPINYHFVYRFKQEHPQTPIIINGDIKSYEAIQMLHLPHVDGVMLGRLACENPYAVAHIHEQLYPNAGPILKRHEAVEQYFGYIKECVEDGIPLGCLIKPLFNLSYGLSHAKKWKSYLMQAIQRKNPDYILEGVESVLIPSSEYI